jgi:predicted nuclease of predicted toxin-antitoxin system
MKRCISKVKSNHFNVAIYGFLRTCKVFIERNIKFAGFELKMEDALYLKILLDEMCTGLKEYLQTLGWDVLTVQDVNLTGASDKKIVEYAEKNGLLLVTQDEKHADLASLRGVPCVLISKIMLTKMIDAELRKNSKLKQS